MAMNIGGVLSGIPTAPGLYTFTVSVAPDGDTPAGMQFTLVIHGQALTIATPSFPNGTTNVAYSQPVSVIGGAGAPYTLSISAGSLPPGINLVGSALTGTPTATGVFAFTIQATDSDSSVATRSYTLAVGVPLVILGPSLPNGIVNVAYPGAQFTGAGGFPPYTWSIATGSLPSGISLNPQSGFLGGTPTQTGAFPFTVTLSDSGGTSVTSGALSLTIIPQFTAPPQMLPSGAVGQPYSATLSASGGTPPYTWVVVSGTLPAGLVLNSNGTIGSTPTTAGTTSFTAKVTDSGAGSLAQTATQAYSITVNPSLAIGVPTLPAGIVNVAYAGAQFTGTGGIPPYSWSIASGSLPSGLSMNPLTGLLSGTPTQAGAFPFAVRLSDSGGGSVTSGALSLTIAPQLTALPQTLPSGAAGQMYSGATLNASGGTPPYTWTLVSGTLLPAGLSLNSNGTITGTPTTPGATSFTAKVTDSGAGSLAQTATQTYSIAVNPSSLAIIVPTLPAGIVNVSYAGAQFTGSGGTPPYTWSVATGSLPSGLSLNPQTGLLSGTPTQAGTFSFSVRLVDSTVIPGTTFSGGLSVTTPVLSLSVIPQLTAPPQTLPSGTVGQSYPTTTLNATGGATPYTWTVASGALPPGLSLSGSGAITGIPTTASPTPFAFTAKVTDSGGSANAGNIIVNGDEYPLSDPGFTNAGSANAAAFALNAAAFLTGGKGSILIYSNSLGVAGSSLQSTLTQAGYSVTEDPTGSTPFTLAALSAYQAVFLGGNPFSANTAVLQQYVQAGGGVYIAAGTGAVAYPSAAAEAAQWNPFLSLYGLSLASQYNGITGTMATSDQPPVLTGVSQLYFNNGNSVSASGPFAQVITSSNGQGLIGTASPRGTLQTATQTYQIAINPTVLTVPQQTLPVGMAGSPYATPLLSPMGGTPPYIWQISSGSLPPGLTLSATGTITGTPTAPGQFSFILLVTDSGSGPQQQSVRVPLSITINPATLAVAPTTLAQAQAGQPYLPNTLMAIGGTPPYSWAPAPGSSLPPGLTLSGVGTISGTPTTSGSFAFYVVVTDSGKPAQTATGYFTINVNTGLAITPSVLPPGDVGTLYKQVQFGISGNISSGATWSVSGRGSAAGPDAFAGRAATRHSDAGRCVLLHRHGRGRSGSGKRQLHRADQSAAFSLDRDHSRYTGQRPSPGHLPGDGRNAALRVDTRWWIASARSNSRPDRHADRVADTSRNLHLHRAGNRCCGRGCNLPGDCQHPRSTRRRGTNLTGRHVRRRIQGVGLGEWRQAAVHVVEQWESADWTDL